MPDLQKKIRDLVEVNFRIVSSLKTAFFLENSQGSKNHCEKKMAEIELSEYEISGIGGLKLQIIGVA